MSIKDLSAYSHLFNAYTELRVQENRTTNIAFVKGSNTANSRSATGGVSARVYKEGSWGFSSNPDITGDTISSAVISATDNAAFLDSREHRGGLPLPSATGASVNDFSTLKPRLSQKELIEFIREIDAHITAKYADLSSRTVALNTLDMEKTVYTSDGAQSHSMVPRSFVTAVLSVEKDGKPVELYQAFGGFGQFEDVFTRPSALYEGIDELYRHLMRKKEGVFAEAGSKTCILDADLAGILAHEAIGHTTEADLVLSGSVAGPWLGREVASPLITLVDYANTYDGETCPCPLYIDDEGTKAEDAVIIDKGILKGFMHNRETALRFGAAPTGNARGFGFSDEPLVRMRNTTILPGADALEDLIASIDDGYYFMKWSNGQADLTSEFMFGVNLGYEIKGGRLGRAIKDTTISGVAFDVLKTVTMVSKDMKWASNGMCGKKQPMPTAMGGPAVKCTVQIGGR